MLLRKALVCLAAIAAVSAFAGLDGSFIVPLDDPAIQYGKGPVSDPVSILQDRMNRGESKLEYNPEFGYLPSVLRNLKTPVSSQVLVYSKTSFQAVRIGPRTPRALYFNDQTSVGWVKGGDVIEVASVDPRQGVIFYTLDQERSASPQFVRRDECLQCHALGSTQGVPGLLVRSIYPDPSGMPLFQAGGYVTDHRSPMKERWGGWYVTGKHGNTTHLGNKVYEDRETPRLGSPESSNVMDLKRFFDTGSYLSPGSDIVALMTLEHQTRMQNLMTRVGYETRLALVSQGAINRMLKAPDDQMSESTLRRINNAAEVLVAYMLFTDGGRIDSPISGANSFAADFESQGPKDRKGRSLRQFDLTRRTFRYPCSYMIYSEAFDAMPEPAKKHVYRRLWEVLTGQDKTPAFASLSSTDRQAVLEILLQTKKNLPEYWR